MSDLTYFLAPSNATFMEDTKLILEAGDVIISDDEYKLMGTALCTSSPEYPEPIKCRVHGAMPEWINGRFVRVGPGKFEWGSTDIKHVFDGDCLAHSFHISAGAVTYSTKFLKSDYHVKNEKYGRVSAAGFGTWAPPDPCANIFKRMFLYFLPSNSNDNANVKPLRINDEAWAATETPRMLRMDPVTLEVTEKVDVSDLIGNGDRGWLAHSHVDKDGTTYVFSTSHGLFSTYDLVRIPRCPSNKPFEGIQILNSLPVSTPMPAYYHSFAMTPNYFVLVENPLFIKSLFSVLTMNLQRKAFLDLLQWRPEVGTVIRIIDRNTGQELRRCRANSIFIFHHANAFERDGDLIVDVCAYPDSSIIDLLYVQTMVSGLKDKIYRTPNLLRYRLPVRMLRKDPKLEPWQLEQCSVGRDYEVLAADFEMPIINYENNGSDYTYVFGIQGVPLRSSLVKVNVKTKEVKRWSPGKKCCASEPYFIPKPGAKSEDDGVIVSAVTGVEDAGCFLVVLDAKSFTEISRAEVPVRIGIGIHGSYWPE